MSKSRLSEDEIAYLKSFAWSFDETAMQFFLDLTPLLCGMVWLDTSPSGTKWLGKIIAVREHIFDDGFETAEEGQYYVLSFMENMVLTAYESLFKDFPQVRQ